MTIAEYLHTLSPFLVKFSETLGIRWYGLSYVAGFVIAFCILRWMGKRQLTPIPPSRAGDALFAVVLGTILGGRLGYVFVYEPSLLTQWDSSAPWWGVLAINKGGMASHGAIVGLVMAAWWVSRGFKTELGERIASSPFLHVLDVLALLSPCGVFLGRIANFINGELLGAIVAKGGQPAPWWAVRYPQELLGWIAPGHRDPASHAPDLTPEQATELWALADSARQPGEPIIAGLRKIVEHAGQHRDALTRILTARHPSQIYQAVAEGLVVGVVIWALWAKPRRPGLIAGVWFIAYGILRVLTEFWRLPDAQFIGAAARPMGLSRGQWLSVAMVVVGFALVAASMRQARRFGGWMVSPGPTPAV